MKKSIIGQVISIERMGHGLNQMYVRLENGKLELYFEEFKDTYNKSLKVGDKVNVTYRYSNFVDSLMSNKPTKIKGV